MSVVGSVKFVNIGFSVICSSLTLVHEYPNKRIMINLLKSCFKPISCKEPSIKSELLNTKQKFYLL